jgi:hypothetical protein
VIELRERFFFTLGAAPALFGGFRIVDNVPLHAKQAKFDTFRILVVAEMRVCAVVDVFRLDPIHYLEHGWLDVLSRLICFVVGSSLADIFLQFPGFFTPFSNRQQAKSQVVEGYILTPRM